MGVEDFADDSPGTEALERHLLRCAAHLQTSLRRDQDPTRQLAAIVAQLRAYTLDLGKMVAAERERARELETSYFETILRLARASAYRDEETQSHADRLGRYAFTLASELGLPARECAMLAAVAPLRDLGKIGIPDAVLRSPRGLGDAEWRMMRRHPSIGASLLRGSSSPLVETARLVALHHHEAWDGSGYPQGLRGEEIPVVGRVVQIADVYDALRSPRPYKPGFSHERACSILWEGNERTRPSQFDPQMLDLFRTLHPRFAAIYDQLPDR